MEGDRVDRERRWERGDDVLGGRDAARRLDAHAVVIHDDPDHGVSQMQGPGRKGGRQPRRQHRAPAVTWGGDHADRIAGHPSRSRAVRLEQGVAVQRLRERGHGQFLHERPHSRLARPEPGGAQVQYSSVVEAQQAPADAVARPVQRHPAACRDDLASREESGDPAAADDVTVVRGHDVALSRTRAESRACRADGRDSTARQRRRDPLHHPQQAGRRWRRRPVPRRAGQGVARLRPGLAPRHGRGNRAASLARSSVAAIRALRRAPLR